jgi:hypothetical protein
MDKKELPPVIDFEVVSLDDLRDKELALYQTDPQEEFWMDPEAELDFNKEPVSEYCPPESDAVEEYLDDEYQDNPGDTDAGGGTE